MNEVPCNNCICLPICLSYIDNADSFPEFVIFTLGLKNRCSILTDYLNRSRPGNYLNFKFFILKKKGIFSEYTNKKSMQKMYR
jgi:hypothetical protein